MEIDGNTSLFVYDKPLREKEQVMVIEFDYKHSTGLKPVSSLPSSTTSKEIWGIETQKWTKVSMMMNSPNYWNDEQIGNKHWFFILDKCLNPDKARGFYNEFLKKELHDHRKVFEVLSSEMKTDYSDKQLSGIGFSSTLENSLLCKVSGKFDRIIEITFAPTRVIKPVKITLSSENIGRCEVCKGDVTSLDGKIECPVGCTGVFHTAHFLEWIRIKGQCPMCKERVSQNSLNKTLVEMN